MPDIPEQKISDEQSVGRAAQDKLDAESSVRRNPHGDFRAVQASRPDWDESSAGFKFTKTRNPDWQIGDGPNDGGECRNKGFVQIDPYEEGRPVVANYKLLISAVVPRVIGFVGTRGVDGEWEWRLEEGNKRGDVRRDEIGVGCTEGRS